MIFPFSFWKARTLQGIDIELSMRAIQERRVVAGHAVWPWPNVIFDSNGNELNGGTGNPVGDYPPDDTYDADVTYSDTFYGDPTGTKAAFLVNDLIDACISTVGFGDYIDPALIEGQASLTIYTASIFPSAGSATTVNYLTKLEDCKTGIRLLTTIWRQVSQIDVAERSGVGPSNMCLLPVANSIEGIIRDFDENDFNNVGAPAGTCTDSGPWDGSGFIGPISYGPPCVFAKNYCAASIAAWPSIQGTPLNSISITNVTFSGVKTLIIRLDSATTFLWVGTSPNDGVTVTPLGVYTRTSGSATTPATLEIELA